MPLQEARLVVSSFEVAGGAGEALALELVSEWGLVAGAGWAVRGKDAGSVRID
jgi:hypothetical protein